MAIKKVELIKTDEPKEKTYSIGDAFQYGEPDYIVQIQLSVNKGPVETINELDYTNIQLSRITDGFCYSEKQTGVKDIRNITTTEFEMLLKNSGINLRMLTPFNFKLVQIPNE